MPGPASHPHPEPPGGAPDLRPSLVSWNITRQCNLNCAHCYRDADARPDPEELTTEQGLALIADIAAVGFRIFVLSGGEPLLRPDFFELLAAAQAAGLRPVLGSNGTLITPEVALRMKQTGLARAGISLDSADPNYHNELRRSPTAWQEAVAGMRACREAGLSFQVNTTVTRQNEDQVLAITDLAIELGAVGHHVFFLVPTGRGVDLAEDMLQAARYEQLLEALLRRQQEIELEIKPTCAPQFVRLAEQQHLATRFTMGCLAGRTYCVITPNGEVHPCPYLPLPAGNLHRERFADVWRNSPIFATFREGPLEGLCGTCRWSRRCFGCRARAYWATEGKLMAEDPWCSLVVRARAAR